MDNMMQIVSVPIITALVYGAMELYKVIAAGKEPLVRLIPVIAELFGVAIGIFAYYVVPSVMPAANILTAILIGGASGLAATGSHQIVKQFKKNRMTRIRTTPTIRTTTAAATETTTTAEVPAPPTPNRSEEFFPSKQKTTGFPVVFSVFLRFFSKHFDTYFDSPAGSCYNGVK